MVGDPTRRAILGLIWDEELPAGAIAAAFDVTFSAISQHLARLRESGAVEARRAGRHRYYRARKEVLAPLVPYLEATWRARLQRLKAITEAEEADR
jgi:DNA-binding transcriptional ArsR family regulator